MLFQKKPLNAIIFSLRITKMDHHNFGSGLKNSKSDHPEVRTLTEFSFQPCMCHLPEFLETAEDDTYKVETKIQSKQSLLVCPSKTDVPGSNSIQVFQSY